MVDEDVRYRWSSVNQIMIERIGKSFRDEAERFSSDIIRNGLIAAQRRLRTEGRFR